MAIPHPAAISHRGLSSFIPASGTGEGWLGDEGRGRGRQGEGEGDEGMKEGEGEGREREKGMRGGRGEGG